jgi:hypothetical protein
MTVNKAEAAGESLSWWDVLDGTMWILVIVFGMIGIGFLRSI